MGSDKGSWVDKERVLREVSEYTEADVFDDYFVLFGKGVIQMTSFFGSQLFGILF